MKKSKGIKLSHNNKNIPHWSERQEKKWSEFQFNQPYEKGLSRLKKEILNKTSFDPAVLWQWGTMQAMAVIGILKNIEKKFGSEGQKAIFESLYDVGYDIGNQITKDTKIPESMSTTEWVSFYATVINTIAYASLESPEIVKENELNFHIDWCPHQDHYKAMDCRVQRYFVQGMLDAAMAFLKSQGREEDWDVMFQTTIPSGSETCHFHMHKRQKGDKERWKKYTELIEKRNLRNI